jgi:tetratricopeptide (TPR) repeat protein
MIRLGNEPVSHRTEEARSEPPPSKQGVRSGKAFGARQVTLTVLLSGVVLASAARIALFLPAVQEWRLSRASLGALVEERGQESNDARLLYHIGLRLNRQERFAEAESNLRRAVGLDPDSARLRDEWARSLVGIGEITEAFNQLRQFVGTHPDSAPGHLILGKFYFTQRSMERAREEFERTVALAPANAEGWAFLARAASQFPGSEKPLEAARRAVALAPKNAEYRLLLASLLSFAAPAEAGAEYARAAELAPDNALVQQQYAAYLAENRRDPEGRVRAEAAARRALALNPKDGATHLCWAVCFRTPDARKRPSRR